MVDPDAITNVSYFPWPLPDLSLTSRFIEIQAAYGHCIDLKVHSLDFLLSLRK